MTSAGRPETDRAVGGRPVTGRPETDRAATDRPVTVLGATVDDQTRCAHYRSELDVVAMRFHCCREFYPCFRCHAEATDHAPSAWPREQFDTHAVVCGVCRETMAISTYLDADSCPACGAMFNPGCALHSSIYFDG